MGYLPRGGNATVPNDALILPAQAFVDFTYQWGGFDPGVFNTGGPDGVLGITFPNKGLTKIAGVLLNIYTNLTNETWMALDLSGNALSSAEVDQIIHNCIVVGINNEPAIQSTIDLSGGTSQQPTQGAAWVDAWALSLQSEVTIKFNLHGGVATIYAPSTSNFSACAMNAAEVNALLAFLVANYIPGASQVLVLTGAPAAPTGQGLTDKATLNGNGWTVTTN